MKFTKFLAFAGLAALFVSCQMETPKQEVSYKDTPVSINVGVCDLVRSGDVSIEGGIGLFFETAGNDDARYNAVNREIENLDGAWVLSGDPLFRLDNTTSVNYYAYAPYQAGQDYSIFIIHPSCPVDFLYAKNITTTAQKDAGNIDLSFEHMLAKFILKLRAGVEVGDNPMLDAVLLGNVSSYAEFDLKEGKWSNVDTEYYTEQNFYSFYNSDLGEYEIACYVIPQTAHYVINFGIYNNNIGEYQIFEYSPSKEQEFVAGTEYTLTLTLGHDEVQAGTMTSNAWNNVEGGTMVVK